MIKNLLLWGVFIVFLFSLFNNFNLEPQTKNISYSQFIGDVKKGGVNRVIIEGQQIKGIDSNNEPFQTYNPSDIGLIGDLLSNGVEVESKPPEQESFLQQLLISIAPVLLLIGIILYTMRGASSMMGGGKNPMSFGRSKAKLITKEQSKITFADVAGVEEAKEEVYELVEFLRDPGKFQKLGGRIPKGVLMVGSPGTGKTLLAKAVAGEAQVPFFFISGSDFVEMFVGVGASRVRDMFEQAKKHAPCIIFIDEIDAVGRQRGAGLGGGHDEREQTLNQMLVEMDGFEGSEGIIVIAATNRPDVLDPALLRPGRFDRQVVVGLPDLMGRDQILKVHMKKLPIAKNVVSLNIARGTPGFSGADLANLVNESALIAATKNKKTVGMQEFEKAKDKILMGSERKSMVMDDKEKEMTAYHEAGHAIIGLIVPEHDPVYKVSIIPRGRALGVTMFLPEKDSYSLSKRKINSQITSLFGGRVAEEIIYGKDSVTTGASNDIERATKLAHNMVKRWGLSDMGPLAYEEEENEVFMGRSVTQHKHISDETSKQIDVEIKKIIDANYQQALKILTEKIDVLHAMAKTLMQYETIDKEQIDALMAGKKPKKPAYTSDDNNSDDSDELSTELGSGSVKKKKRTVKSDLEGEISLDGNEKEKSA